MAMVVSNLRGGQFRNQLNLGAQNLVTELREKLNMSLSGQPTRVCDDGSAICENDPAVCVGDCVEQVPLGGYGLVLAQGEETITLFADIDTENPYQDFEMVRELVISPTGSVAIKSINTDLQSLTGIEIVFVPPDAEIVFHGVTGEPSQATITLEHLNTGEEREVTINRISGRIDVD